MKSALITDFLPVAVVVLTVILSRKNLNHKVKALKHLCWGLCSATTT